VPLDEFESVYRRLLSDTKAAVGCRLILCQASIIGERRTDPHNPIIDEYNACIAGLAREFGAALAPMNDAFWHAIGANPARQWTMDGVHPLSNGHLLMAQTLFETLSGAAS
jgi:acyl-CoA thioesterase I